MAFMAPVPGGPRCPRAPGALAMVLAGVLLTACHATPGGTNATASDEWKRSYTLAPGGEVQVTNRNGAITVTAADGDTVEVRAERTVTAPTEAAARDLLPKVEIREDIRPDHVELQTAGVSGILINVSWAVHYHVRAPRTSVVRVRSGNGAVDVNGFSGRVIASSANGGLNVSALAGGAEIRSTNGDVHADFARIGADLIEVRATNGQVRATLPADAHANLLATATNGRVEVDGLTIEPMGEQTARRVRGRLGTGGTPIELTATNGNITVTRAGQ